ncbi:MAG: substrate-binding domain-containing protein [Treponema sp.]|nr:substrate-binding domain-containing protein [Treponema sp.]
MADKVTLKNISDTLGISIATVHRALSGKDRVSIKTRDRIIQCASEMGYQPTFLANPAPVRYKMNFAFICPDNLFYQEIIHGAKTATSEYGTTGLTTHFLSAPDYSPETQMQQLRAIINEKNYDGVAICPTHTMLLNPLINSLVEAGIPVVTFNNDISESKRNCFIGEEPLVSGSFTAQLYSMILPSNSTVAILQSLVSAEGLRLRIKGFEDYIHNNPKLKISGKYDFFDSIENAYKIARELLLSTKVDAIFINSMMGTIGASKAISELKHHYHPLLIGYDMNNDIKGFIKSNVILGTLLQSPVRQGYLVVKKLFELCNMKDRLKTIKRNAIYLPIQLILKSNLEQNNDYEVFHYSIESE